MREWFLPSHDRMGIEQINSNKLNLLFILTLMIVTHHPGNFPLAVSILPDVNKLKRAAILFSVFRMAELV
jgi:hypothetical protein